MRSEDSYVVSRRRVLTLGLVLGAASSLLGTRLARAQKTSKEHALYQDSPNGGFRCSDCRFFIASQGGAKKGTCQFVEGEISPDGWCAFYNPRA